MKNLFPILAAFCMCALTGCQKADVLEDVAEPRNIEFRVTNYEQYVLNTRATTVDTLDHLSMAIYTADTDQLVTPVVTQNRGASGYGTFRISLPDGVYRVVFLGYMKDNALEATSSEAISFAGGYVPHTFLYSTLLTVDENTQATQDVVLARAIGAFQLVMTDAMPSGITTMQFVSDRGGAVLNAQTGECAQNTGRSYNMTITNTSAYWGKTGDTFTIYYFLPKEGTTMNITVNALDSKGTVVWSRTFDNAPMAINQMTTFEGDFFVEPTTDVAVKLSLDNAWAEKVKISF